MVNKKVLKAIIMILVVTLFLKDRTLQSQNEVVYNTVTEYSDPLMFILAENLIHDPDFAQDKRLGRLMDHNHEDIVVLVDFLQRYQKGEIVKDYLDKQVFLITDMYLRRLRRSGMRFNEFRISDHVKKDLNFSTYQVRFFSEVQNYLASIVLSDDSSNHRDRKIIAVNFEKEKEL